MSRHRLRPALRHNALSVAGGGGFVGAYDDTPNLAALYAMRLGLTSYYGSPLIRVRRSSDNAEDDIGHLSNGDLDTAAVADFLSGGSATIVTWYDHKNGNDATQSTAAAQPLYVANGQNSRPVMRFDGSDDELSNGSAIVTGSTNRSILAVSTLRAALGDKRTETIVYLGAGADTGRSEFACTFEYAIRYSQGATEFQETAAVDTAELTVFGLDGNTVNDAFLYRNGSAATVSSSSNPGETVATDAGMTIGTFFTDLVFAEMDLSELVIADTAWSTAERGDAEQAAADYWGITLS